MEPHILLNAGILIEMHPILQNRIYTLRGADNTNRVRRLANVSALGRIMLGYRLYSQAPLQGLLQTTWYALATEARDRIFALVSLCTDVPKNSIDYRQSRREVAIKFAMHLLIKAWDLTECLSSAHVMQWHDLPSWAPDWTGNPLSKVPVSSIMSKDSLINYGDPEYEIFLDGKDISITIGIQNILTSTIKGSPILKIRGRLLEQVQEIVSEAVPEM